MTRKDAGRHTARRHVSVVAAAAVLVSAVLMPVVGALTAAPAAAAPTPIGTVHAAFSSHRGTNGAGTAVGTSADASNCVRYDPSQGTFRPSTVRAAHGRAAVESRLTYRGISALPWESDGSECLGTITEARSWGGSIWLPISREYRHQGQSRIGFTPVAPSTVESGRPFVVGTFRHDNYPIVAAASHFEGTLGVRVGALAEVAATYVLHETPDTNGAVSDTVAFAGLARTFPVKINQLDYDLTIQGFAPGGNATTASCGTSPSGTPSTTVVTTENAVTHSCLWARLDQVRPLTIVKRAVAVGDAPASVPTSTFDSTSNVAGSPWQSGSFPLTPASVVAPADTATLAASSIRAAGETVSVTERTPATDWSVTSIECRDGANAAVGATVVTDVGSRTVTLTNVPEVASTTAAPITCTFVGTYTAPTTLTLVSLTQVATGDSPSAGWAFAVDALGRTVTTGATGSVKETVEMPAATRTVTVTETVPSNFVVARVSCYRNDQPGTVTTTRVNPFQLTLQRGRSYTCSVLNLRSEVDLVKEAFLTSDNTFASPLPAGAEHRAGTPVTWRYTVRNVGQTTLNDVKLRDTFTVTTTGGGTTPARLTQISCPEQPGITPGTVVTIPTLAPGDQVRCRASGVL